MGRAIATCACLAALAAGCGSGHAGGPTALRKVHFEEPPAALPSTARLAIAAGDGAERLALWTATNAWDELCLGWRLGAATAAPATFTCLRRGLERPILTVEGGGGTGVGLTWGTLVGLASPRVTRVSVELGPVIRRRELRLRPVAGLAGWRAFTSGLANRPPSTVNAYGRDGLLVQDNGLWLQPPGAKIPAVVTIPAPPPTGPSTNPPPRAGPSWGTHATVPGSDKSDERAVRIALAQRDVRSILSTHVAWLDSVAGWSNCRGRDLGRVVSFRFPSAITFTATLPHVDKPAGKFSYSETVRKVLATDWHEMSVWVDATAGAVVGVDTTGSDLPNQNGDITIPLDTRVPPHDMGGPDTGDCWQSD